MIYWQIKRAERAKRKAAPGRRKGSEVLYYNIEFKDQAVKAAEEKVQRLLYELDCAVGELREAVKSIQAEKE